jgi:hypothetical protein
MSVKTTKPKPKAKAAAAAMRVEKRATPPAKRKR